MNQHPIPHRTDRSPRAAGGTFARRVTRAGRWFVRTLQRHVWAVAAVVVAVALLATPFATKRIDAEEPSFDPEGEIYEVMDLVDERFNTSDVVPVQFVVEARDGDALRRDVLLEWLDNTEELLATPLEGGFVDADGDRICGGGPAR